MADSQIPNENNKRDGVGLDRQDARDAWAYRGENAPVSRVELLLVMILLELYESNGVYHKEDRPTIDDFLAQTFAI